MPLRRGETVRAFGSGKPGRPGVIIHVEEPTPSKGGFYLVAFTTTIEDPSRENQMLVTPWEILGRQMGLRANSWFCEEMVEEVEMGKAKLIGQCPPRKLTALRVMAGLEE